MSPTRKRKPSKRKKATKKKAPLQYSLTRATKSMSGDPIKSIVFKPYIHTLEQIKATIEAINWKRFESLQYYGRRAGKKHLPTYQPWPAGVYASFLLKTGREYSRVADITPEWMHCSAANIKNWLIEAMELALQKAVNIDTGGNYYTRKKRRERSPKNLADIDFAVTRLLQIDLKYIYRKTDPFAEDLGDVTMGGLI